MPEIGDVRQNEAGFYEILTLIEVPGDPIYGGVLVREIVGYEEQRETWQPLLTFLARQRVLMHGDEVLDPSLSVHDELVAEGWIPPSEARHDPDLCLERRPPHRLNGELFCTRLQGHEGEHRDATKGWTWT